MASKMDLENIFGLMEMRIWGLGSRTRFGAKGLMSGLMGGCIAGTGKLTKWTGRAFIHGLMAASTRGGIVRIRNRDMECIAGLMARCIWATGSMVNNMASGTICYQTDK